jgi:hypothetical protein
MNEGTCEIAQVYVYGHYNNGHNMYKWFIQSKMPMYSLSFIWENWTKKIGMEMPKKNISIIIAKVNII